MVSFAGAVLVVGEVRGGLGVDFAFLIAGIVVRLA